MRYTAFLHKEGDQWVAVVPDLGYVSSFGETFEEAVDNIKEAAELYCEDLERLPRPTPYEELAKSADIENGAIPQIIDVKAEKSVRVNIMMRSDLLRIADEKAKAEYNGNRSAYIQELIAKDAGRRIY